MGKILEKAIPLGDYNCNLDVFLNEHPEITIKTFQGKTFIKINENVDSLSFFIFHNELLELSFIYKGQRFKYCKKI